MNSKHNYLIYLHLKLHLSVNEILKYVWCRPKVSVKGEVKGDLNI